MMCVQIKKNSQNFSKPFVIVTGPALALPPLLFYRNTMLCVYHSLDANDSHASMQTRIVYSMWLACNMWRIYDRYIRVVFLLQMYCYCLMLH